jgi:hypothetical protein
MTMVAGDGYGQRWFWMHTEVLPRGSDRCCGLPSPGGSTWHRFRPPSTPVGCAWSRKTRSRECVAGVHQLVEVDLSEGDGLLTEARGWRAEVCLGSEEGTRRVTTCAKLKVGLVVVVCVRGDEGLLSDETTGRVRLRGDEQVSTASASALPSLVNWVRDCPVPTGPLV